MLINRTILLTCIFGAYPAAGLTNCINPTSPESERTLEYYGCLQNELIEAQLKASIKGEQNKNEGSNGLQNLPGQALFKGVDIPTTQTPLTPPITYVGYSSSNLGTEAIISYGGSKTRVKIGNLLRDGWKVQNITPGALIISGNGKTKTIPLNTGGEN